MADELKVPDFDDLPDVNGMPKGCAWGVFDKGGKKDVYGTLNLLTPSVVRAAAAEVKEGVSVSLNWPIGAIKTPGFGRKGLVHKVMSFRDTPFAIHGFDDEVEFNTQCSSQWDSLCHFHHQPTGTAYNGGKPTVQDLEQVFGAEDHAQTYPTLNHWHSRGGLVGRGVLIDYKRWADAKGIKYDPFSDHRITTKELEEVAQEEGVTFKQGDIIIVRSGFTEALTGLSGEEQEKGLETHKACGVEGTPESAKWFWNKHFAAVAGDAIAFEAIPPQVDGKEGQISELGEFLRLIVRPYYLELDESKLTLAPTAQSCTSTSYRCLACPSVSCGISRRCRSSAPRARSGRSC